MTYQWTVFQADLNPTEGQEQAGERPVLVVSAEPLNETYKVVSVIPMTSRKGGRPARLGEVLLKAGVAGLRQDSFALCYQIRALDKSRLHSPYGSVEDESLQAEILETHALCLDIS